MIVGLLVLIASVVSQSGLGVRQITSGPKHHFFGYIGHVQNIPWNQSGRLMLALRTEFQDRMPSANDPAEIVLLDTMDNYSERVIDRTLAWNPQQGTMLYWNPMSPETQFFFNDRDPKTGKVFCVLFDMSSGPNGSRVREYRFEDSPIGNSGVAQMGGWFSAINYARLHRLRPVTGYPDAFDWTGGQMHPSSDGVFRVDAATGQKRLLVSFSQLADALRPTHRNIDQSELFINHTLSNRDSDRIFFFVRADFEDRTKRVNEPFLINPDGSGLRRMSHFLGGHPEWADGRQMIGALDGQQVMYDTDSDRVVRRIGTDGQIISPEGDIALSPNGKWLVNGWRQGNSNRYAFVNLADDRYLQSGEFDVTGWTGGSLRCDPAPCWNRTSNAIVVPAIANDANKTRQMFLISIPE
jgi:hypothetical protein